METDPYISALPPNPSRSALKNAVKDDPVKHPLWSAPVSKRYQSWAPRCAPAEIKSCQHVILHCHSKFDQDWWRLWKSRRTFCFSLILNLLPIIFSINTLHSSTEWCLRMFLIWIYPYYLLTLTDREHTNLYRYCPYCNVKFVTLGRLTVW